MPRRARAEGASKNRYLGVSLALIAGLAAALTVAATSLHGAKEAWLVGVPTSVHAGRQKQVMSRRGRRPIQAEERAPPTGDEDEDAEMAEYQQHARDYGLIEPTALAGVS